MVTSIDPLKQVAGIPRQEGAPDDPGAAPLIDVGRAIANLGGSADTHRAVTDVFLEHLPQALAALDAAAEPARLLPLVHELGSSLGTVGAMRAHGVARRLETRWRRGEPVDAVRSTAELRAVVMASAAALRAAVARGG